MTLLCRIMDGIWQRFWRIIPTVKAGFEEILMPNPQKPAYDGKETVRGVVIMFAFEIATAKYDVDVGELLSRRLLTYPNSFCIVPSGCGVLATVEGEDAVSVAANAMSALLLRDLIYFELARMTDQLPLELPEKQEVLTETLRLARDGSGERALRRELTEYFQDQKEINLEGFMQFRMKRQLLEWQMMVERAAQEKLMSREYSELLSVLGAFVRMQQPRVGEISICINPDGSCTLTDDSDARIEYVDCSEDGIVGLLVSMAPSRLIVYDLSGGQGKKLADAIAKVFSGRVRVYR